MCNMVAMNREDNKTEFQLEPKDQRVTNRGAQSSQLHILQPRGALSVWPHPCCTLRQIGVIVPVWINPAVIINWTPGFYPDFLNFINTTKPEAWKWLACSQKVNYSSENNTLGPKRRPPVKRHHVFFSICILWVKIQDGANWEIIKGYRLGPKSAILSGSHVCFHFISDVCDLLFF